MARNIFTVETGQKISLSEFLRRIAELGYTKVWETAHRGEFSQRGGAIHIFPINTSSSYTIEFEGNYISEILKTKNLEDEISRRGRPSRNTISTLSAMGLRKFQTRDSLFVMGDYVVHIDHGIGIFRGEAAPIGGEPRPDESGRDFVIEYAPPSGRPHTPDLLYIPKTLGEEHLMFAKRVQPYLGFKKPTIHRLGTSVWALTKKKAKEDIIAFAKTLLETLAQRHSVTRAPYHAYSAEEEELEANFMHEDTPDQKKAIKEIFDDMAHSYPMDRILTGDVGFGKTEVAIRAALRVALNERQVVLMAPTTILADQHYELFKSRLESFGVSVARLTRLESNTEIKSTLERLSKGAVDIVIGTHKLLSKKIAFKNLGLLIIDEEQKFGVTHKEHFKKLHPAIDILSLSATPIPRTLHLGLSKIQSLSQITTPPSGRTEIKTFVLPKNKKIMKEAIEYELARSGPSLDSSSRRGGQIYFLANRIHKIPALLEEIKKLKLNKSINLPLTKGEHEGVYEKTLTSQNPSFVRREKQVRISVLHGRMHEKQIIQTMHDFREGKIDILVSTTIIENGLDISEANTLIVEDATKLGLAQAHQLRGRIGRGNKEAFAYFFYPAQSRSRHYRDRGPSTSLSKNLNSASGKLSEKAAERLEALERYSWLGAGIEIAKRDLELRGCGNILGKAQSGIAYKVGLNLYFQLLEEAMGELKNQTV